MANEKRLIDANALIDEWNEIIKRMVKDSDGKTPVDFGLVIREVSKAPTVDAVEVVHGRWDVVCEYEDFRYASCSACGKRSEYMTKYCPNCGAKMDGDGNG